MPGLPSWAGCWAITGEIVVVTAAILTRLGGHSRAQLGERRELDSFRFERRSYRLRDLRRVRRVAVDADALRPKVELPAVDRPDGPLANAAQPALPHLLRVAELLRALEHELSLGVVVEVDVALRHERHSGPGRGRTDGGRHQQDHVRAELRDRVGDGVRVLGSV